MNYKRSISVFLVMMCVNSVFAQLQTNILGCKLGVSTKSSVEQTLKSKGLSLVKSEAADVMEGVTFYDITDGVSFGGILWDDARIRFVDGKFASITFNKVSSIATFDKLLSALKKKYAKYMKSSEYPAPYFQDSRTEIILMDGNKLSLSYAFRKLFEDSYNNDSGKDEL